MDLILVIGRVVRQLLTSAAKRIISSLDREPDLKKDEAEVLDVPLLDKEGFIDLLKENGEPITE